MSADTLVVDWTRCDGHGLCAELLPELISLDDWGYPVVATAAAQGVSQRNVEQAVRTCPALALRTIRDKSRG